MPGDGGAEYGIKAADFTGPDVRDVRPADPPVDVVDMGPINPSPVTEVARGQSRTDIIDMGTDTNSYVDKTPRAANPDGPINPSPVTPEARMNSRTDIVDMGAADDERFSSSVKKKADPNAAQVFVPKVTSPAPQVSSEIPQSQQRLENAKRLFDQIREKVAAIPDIRQQARAAASQGSSAPAAPKK